MVLSRVGRLHLTSGSPCPSCGVPYAHPMAPCPIMGMTDSPRAEEALPLPPSVTITRLVNDPECVLRWP